MLYILIALAAFILFVIILERKPKEEQNQENQEVPYFPVDPDTLPIEDGGKKPVEVYEENSLEKTYLVAEQPTVVLPKEEPKKAVAKKKAAKKPTDQKVVKRVETMKLEEKPKAKSKTKGK
jgi:hypothetical protein